LSRPDSAAKWQLGSALPFLVLAAAAIGIGLPSAGRALADHSAIDATLGVLVFASAVGIDPKSVAISTHQRRRLAVVWAVTTVSLPMLAWAVSRVVPAGGLRDGVLTVGLAPSEVAVLAMTSVAGASVVAAAALLVASTATAVLVAGPALSLMAGDGGVDAFEVLTNLGFVVGAPMVTGLLFGRLRAGATARRAADPIAMASVIVLAWLVASQVEWSSDYVAVVVALIGFVGGGAVIGWLLARVAPAELVTPIVLSASMRDFAIASGIATAAFGASAAGPLGIYGILVLAWGAVVTKTNRQRAEAASLRS